jgi:hypothetical protein
MAKAGSAYAKAAKAYKAALDAADAIGEVGPDCLLIVIPGPCQKDAVISAWMRTQHLKWAASADAAGAFLNALEAIRWPDRIGEAQAGDLVNTLSAHRAIMVKGARASTYRKEHDAYFAAFAFARNVQLSADALRHALGLRPIHKRSGIFFATNAY